MELLHLIITSSVRLKVIFNNQLKIDLVTNRDNYERFGDVTRNDIWEYNLSLDYINLAFEQLI